MVCRYSQYEKAIALALSERYAEEQQVVVMVVGAGRGPLVRCTLNAAKQAQRKVKVYAVEKNPNAVVTLQHQKLSTWGDQVVCLCKVCSFVVFRLWWFLKTCENGRPPSWRICW